MHSLADYLRQQTQQAPRLSLVGYFRNFCETHGQPVDDGVRLIFPDGWCYARRDYKGPEVAPPTEERELYKLLLIYWSIRLNAARVKHAKFTEALRVLHETSKQKSAPISIEAWEPNAGGYLRPTACNVDWQMLEYDLQSSAQDVRDCERELEKLNRQREMLI
jgi:hypothetical protein